MRIKKIAAIPSGVRRPLCEVFQRVDAETDSDPPFFVINCVGSDRIIYARETAKNGSVGTVACVPSAYRRKYVEPDEGIPKRIGKAIL
jgi:hypothetical protein